MSLLPIKSVGSSKGSSTNFKVGSEVEYFSESQQVWIEAVVLSCDTEKGTYNLNCKPGVSSSSIRWRDPEKELTRKNEEAMMRRLEAEQEAELTLLRQRKQ